MQELMREHPRVTDNCDKKEIKFSKNNKTPREKQFGTRK